MDAAASDPKILILEDSPSDAELVERSLKRGGLSFKARRADGKAAFAEALEAFSPDVVLADCKLPDYDGLSAVKLVRESHPDLPVIMVTGALGDEAAVELLKAGANDYVLKDRLARLPFAVERALAEAAVIREHRQAERRILEDEAQFRSLVEQEIAGIFIVGTDGRIAYINPRFAQMVGYTPAEVLGRNLIEFIPAADRSAVSADMAALLSGEKTSVQIETRIVRKDGLLLDALAQGAMAAYHGEPAIIGVALDVTERKRTERALRTLSSANETLVRAVSEAELLGKMCEVIVNVGGYRLAWIGFAEHNDAKTVRPVAWAGHDDGYLQEVKVSWGDNLDGHGPTGEAIRTGQRQINQNVETNPAVAPWRKAALAHGYRSSVSLPLADGARVYGALCIYAGEPDAFTEEEVDLLAELAEDLSYGVNSLRAKAAREETAEKLHRSLSATVTAIAATLEIRDPYTAGHQRKVAVLAAAIARDVGVPDSEVEGIYLAGVVHDIGKVQIPAEILSKPGKLTALEFELIKTHPQAGHDIVKGVEFPWPIPQIIIQHHERLDGSGYPKGLKGDDILLGAKILAVADVVEAMSAHRPYRQALGIDAALEEVIGGRGRLYDPAAVDACANLFRQKGFKFP